MTAKTRKQNSKENQRPPIVVVLGHIDHGKTTLLSKIRQKNMPVEAGEITQSIGAYQAKRKNKSITFIDTPGHRAFSCMRERGTAGADIAVLVIAADAGLQAQTKECIKTIKQANVPVVIAWNKMDLPTANPNAYQGELKKYNLEHCLSVEVSAKNGQGIDELLEGILLLSQEIDLSYNLSKKPKFVLLETHFDSRQGLIVDLILKQGQIKTGDNLSGFEGSVRQIKDCQGKIVKQIIPGMPGRILGLKIDKTIAEQNKPKKSFKKKLNIVVKANTQGALEAIVWALKEKKQVNVLQCGVGQISEKDLLKASPGDLAIGFQVNADACGKNFALR